MAKLSIKKESKPVLRNFINGSFYEPMSREYIKGFNPATGEVNAEIPDSDDSDVGFAVKAAKRAFLSWSKFPVEKRARILVRLADLIDMHREELAAVESEDSGKPLSLAMEVDIPRAAENFRFFGSAIRHFSSEAHPMQDRAINYTLRKPLGVVGCISPWNLPLYLFTWKIAPALAAGNCVVGKPSEVTPKSAFMLGEICKEAGLPNGVLNIIHGLGNKAGKAIVEHPDIKAVSFTGGTTTGIEIAKSAASQLKKCSLELGGKNPNIIFADCDFSKALNTTLLSSFRNQGQICLCGSRIFVQKSIYEKFKTEFAAKTYLLKVGDPQKSDTDLGAVASESHMNKILYYINLAKEEGGNILTGGNQVELKGRCSKGWFVEPTIIDGLSNSCRVNQEEIFGPVVTLIPFESEEEVVEMANDNPYGLSATIWTSNLSRSHRMADQLDAGVIWVNTWMMRDLRTPFGGMKQSGLGREGGLEALKFFTEPKNVCIHF